MDQLTQELIAHLSGYVTENRLSLFRRVLAERTRYISVLLEDIYQSQNASAVLRTCDCNGIQDVHIVEDRNEYTINRDVALGADQWLTLHYYNKGGSNIEMAIRDLKERNYRIVATSPHKDGVSPESIDLDKGKAVLLFGTELNGLTDKALELADEFIQIPMAGFTESYNISVSAAIILYTLRKRLEASSLQWKLEKDEEDELLLNWLRTSIKMSEQIENKFLKDYNSKF
jgi:tRNA (guanosine-2'-O-)-methyltransferase